MSDEVDELAKVLWDYNQMHHVPERSDAILALGSMDIRVAERAAELWHQGAAPIIVVAGGYGRLTGAGSSVPEAEQFRAAIRAAKVPQDRILVENASANTAENFRFAIALLESKDLVHSAVTVVTKPYMERRAYATFRKLYPDIAVHLTSPQVGYEDYPNRVISKDLMLNILVGDTQRVKLYAEKGFSIPQDLPAEVEAAMYALIRQGYDKQLAK